MAAAGGALKRRYKDGPEVFQEDYMRGDANCPDLGRVLCEESALAVDWDISAIRSDLSLVSHLGGPSSPRTHRGEMCFPGVTVSYGLMEKLEHRAEGTPEQARITLKTTVKKLLTDRRQRLRRQGRHH